MKLVYLSFTFVLGICLGSQLNNYWGVLLTATALPAILLYKRDKKLLVWGSLCCILLIGGFFRAQLVPAGDELQSYRGVFYLRGVIAADPEVRDYGTQLRLEVMALQTDGEWRTVRGTALVNAPTFAVLDKGRDFPYYRYGDLLEMSGTVQSPQSATDESEFDFCDYLARQGVYSVIASADEIVLIEAGQKPIPMVLIHRLRNLMSGALDNALPEPQGSLAKAMLLGQRGTIPAEVKEDFARTGTSHLLAISGVHVSIVAGIALGAGVWAFGRRRPTYFLIAIAVIWLYAVLTGFRPSAMRAAIMASLWLYSDRIGRQHSAFTAIAFAAAIMLAINPLLLYDVGFQLSFSAMAGLILLTPIFQARSKRVFGNEEGDVSPTTAFVVTSCAVTLGAVIATLPLIAYYFGMISLVSLPATLVTLPAVSLVIISSAAVGLVGVFTPAVADVLGWISWISITYILEVVELFARMPFAAINVEANAPIVGGYYGILLAGLWLPRNGQRVREGISGMKNYFGQVPRLYSNSPKKWIILPLSVIAILICVAVLTSPDDRLHVYVLDVGQGDSILIQKGNSQILIDGGDISGNLARRLGDKLPFWDRTIELMVLTHPHDDHVAGLVDVLRRYDVRKVLTSGQEGDSGAYQELCNLIGEKGIEEITAQVGQRITLGEDVELAVLHPSDSMPETLTTDINDGSVVLRLEFDRFSCLLTGDIGNRVEDYLLNQAVCVRSTVLKVAHHGSPYSTSAEFLGEVAPTFAVISVGADNSFGHPAEEVVMRLDELVGAGNVLKTSEHGTIEFITDGERLLVKTAE